ncbi:hypothetical protein MTR67_023229 [Solanum verrucosum]|uniref:Uncharacterized protein n=1 Tax=Solanum verrucosum TaxID=315347 RepID=A0AAF0TS03_SOLVR|nr:hypothetical protein MTR67_023229 [Solanum verrucosum]
MKGSFEESKDQCVNETYNGKSRTVLKEGLNRKDAGDVNNNKILFEDPRKERVEVQVEHMQDCGDNIGDVSMDFGKNRNTLTLDDFVMPPMRESHRKTSFFTAPTNPIDPPFEFGVGRVNLMDWFYPSTYPDILGMICDCGLYTCFFPEYVCRGDIISMLVFDCENLRLRYKALLWDYRKEKIDTGTISDKEDS